jgi:lipopolysaccharide/colanic/teichoic acid biosynthesis glycosyltransferase
MRQNKEHKPEVYKRLELVRKQFQRQAAEQKKLQAAEKRQRMYSRLRRNKTWILRLITYVVLGAVLLAVVLVIVLD